MNNAHGSVNEARRKLPRSPFRAPQSHFAHLFGLCFLALLQNICTKSLTAHANITQLQTYTTWNIVSWKDKLHKNKRNSEYVVQQPTLPHPSPVVYGPGRTHLCQKHPGHGSTFCRHFGKHTTKQWVRLLPTLSLILQSLTGTLSSGADRICVSSILDM